MAMQSCEIQLKKILDHYSAEMREAVTEAGKTVSREAAKKLRATSPKQSKSGGYAKGWTTKSERGPGGVPTYIVYNKTHPGLTHLLEKGHAVANQFGHYERPNGRVAAIPHIAPVEEWATSEFEAEIERRMQE